MSLKNERNDTINNNNGSYSNFTDDGEFYGDDGDDNEEDEEEDSIYCSYCDLDTPLRSHHCRICNLCVATFDHHCNVIGTCIGEKNHCRFFTFVLLNFIGVWVYSMIVESSFQLQLGKEPSPSLPPMSTLSVASVYAILTCIRIPFITTIIHSYHHYSTMNMTLQDIIHTVTTPIVIQSNPIIPKHHPEIAYIATTFLGLIWWYLFVLLAFQTFLIMTSFTSYECIKGPEKLSYLYAGKRRKINRISTVIMERDENNTENVLSSGSHNSEGNGDSLIVDSNGDGIDRGVFITTTSLNNAIGNSSIHNGLISTKGLNTNRPTLSPAVLYAATHRGLPSSRSQYRSQSRSPSINRRYYLRHSDGYDPCDMPFGNGLFTNFSTFCCERDAMIIAWRGRGIGRGSTGNQQQWTPHKWVRPPPRPPIESVTIADNCWRNKYYNCC